MPTRVLTTLRLACCFGVFILVLGQESELPQATSTAAPYQSEIRIVIVTAMWGLEPGTRDETELCLKSIFRHTHSNVHISFIVTHREAEAIRDIMQQLTNPGFNVSYSFTWLHAHFVEMRARELGVPIRHHSGVPGYAKFLLTELLPKEERILLLDTDILVGADLARLWRLFDAFTNETLFSFPGLSYQPIGNHVGYFCTGVGLLHLGRMREAGWGGTFTMDAFAAAREREWDKQEAERLLWRWGDQSMFIAVTEHHKPTRKLNAPLPLSWNLEQCHHFHGLTPATAGNSSLFWGIVHYNCAYNASAKPAVGPWGLVYKYMQSMPWAWVSEGRLERSVQEVQAQS